KLRLQTACLVQQPRALSVICQQQIFLEPGVSRPAWLRENFVQRPLPGFLPSALLARREAFDVIGMFDESYRAASDAYWFFRASALGVPPAVVPEVLVDRRIHRANQSH